VNVNGSIDSCGVVLVSEEEYSASDGSGVGRGSDTGKRRRRIRVVSSHTRGRVERFGDLFALQ
jgi:hypothetical protein